MTAHESEKKFGIDELAHLGGVTRRTVRYYVQRGLLPQPTGTGRGLHYTERHLRALLCVRALQESGISLDEILEQRPGAGIPKSDQARPPEPRPAQRLPMPQPWTRITLADGIELHVRNQPPGPARIRAIVDAVRAALASTEGDSQP